MKGRELPFLLLADREHLRLDHLPVPGQNDTALALGFGGADKGLTLEPVPHLPGRAIGRLQIEGVGALMAAAEFRRGFIDQNFPLGNDNDAVTEGFHLLKNMGRKDDRFILGHPRHDLAHFVLLVRIQSVRRLIEDKDGRIMDHRLGKPDPLLIPLRKRFNRLVADTLQKAEGEHLIDPFAAGRPIAEIAAFGNEKEKLLHRHLRVGGAALREVSNPAAGLQRILPHIESLHQGRSGGRLEETGEDLHRRRLARAIRTEKAEDIAFIDLEVYVINSPDRTVIFYEVLHVNHGENRISEGKMPAIQNETVRQSNPNSAENPVTRKETGKADWKMTAGKMFRENDCSAGLLFFFASVYFIRKLAKTARARQVERVNASAEITFHECRGARMQAWLAGLGRLRISVFREFPYLYEGTLEYEERYLATYFAAPESYAVLARQGSEIIGASTGVPMRYEATHRDVLARAGFDPEEIFYFGESVLLPAYRGRGIGQAFFRYRETYARSLPGIRWTAFCALERPETHPRRPPNYRPLHGFWQKLGYTRRPDLPTTISWKDLDEPGESPKTLLFWLKELGK